MLPVFSIGSFTIYTYPLMMGLGMGLILNSLYQRNVTFKSSLISTIVISIMSWLGAKSFFILFSSQHIEKVIELRSFWFGGGFVFYGGLIFGLLGLISLRYFSVLSDGPANELMKLIPLGHAIGRVGCFLAGCCYGLEVHGHPLPVPLFETTGNIILFFILRKNGITFLNSLSLYLIGYGLLRFCLEFFRADTIRGFVFGSLSYSMLISLVLIFIGAVVFKLARR